MRNVASEEWPGTWIGLLAIATAIPILLGATALAMRRRYDLVRGKLGRAD